MQNEITITAEQVERIKRRIDLKRKQTDEAAGKGRNIEAARREGESMGLEYALWVLGIEF